MASIAIGVAFTVAVGHVQSALSARVGGERGTAANDGDAAYWNRGISSSAGGRRLIP